MKQQRFDEAQIIGILKQQESGVTRDRVSRCLISVGNTRSAKASAQRAPDRWKSKYGGMEVHEATRLRQLENAKASHSKWDELRVQVTAKVQTQLRYFLSSAQDDPAALAQAIRRHWSIENNLPWVLDVTFAEDESRVRQHNAVCNWAILRKIALNLLGRDPAKISLKAKRKKAAWNNDYMAHLLQPILMR